MNSEVHELIGELVEKYLFDEIDEKTCQLLSDLFGGKIDVDDFNQEREKIRG